MQSEPPANLVLTEANCFVPLSLDFCRFNLSHIFWLGSWKKKKIRP